MSEESCRLSCAHRQAPAQILLSPQVMYERALAVFPLTHFLWLRYARYLEATLKSTSLVMPVYARAARNCPWVGTVWGRYVNALDRSGAAEEQQAPAYARALSAGLQVRCSLFARCSHSSLWPNQQRQCLYGVLRCVYGVSMAQAVEQPDGCLNCLNGAAVTGFLGCSQQFSAALQFSLQTSEDYMEVVLARLDAVRRRGKEAMPTLRAAFAAATATIQVPVAETVPRMPAAITGSTSTHP